ncbi:MAG: polysaccharide pyruvyl transferase CsaB [Oscillospiraceae bacterium]|nr:polysaccharide pyruvyl transferase CsaB [Oscillospiraceae bacterium]
MNNKRILMATMRMDIGGAETHILELSKALRQRGYEITVASNGGVYVPELEAAGVRHVTIPLHRRSLWNLARSYFALRRLVKSGEFDLVHAHARIPSFLCGLLWRRLKFPFVTTAHFTFTTGGLAGKLTNWGEKTIAVSEDIKTYLIDHYGVRDEEIFTTVNGIDMDRFSKTVPGDSVRAELGIPEDAPVVLQVSRLDEGPATPVEQLLEATATLAQETPNLHVVIVGSGNQFDRLRAKAEAVNTALGRTALHMTGLRTDVNACLATANVFVGVSRAALEAMSAELPVVLAGPQGYGGIFGADKLALSRDTNFCYRGCELSSANAILRDVRTCLAMTPEARSALGQYGKETVRQYYSVETMTEDTIKAYKAVLYRPKRLLVSGYYGFHNAGDEAILDAFVQSTKDLPVPVKVTILSKTPAETAKKHGAEAVSRFNPFAVFRAMRNTDVLVSGGGSLLQDKSSTRSIIYYLSIIRLAKLLGKPVMLYANGIGPVDRPANRRRVRKVVSQADMITLREESSREELLRMGVTAPELHVTADPIFLLSGADEDGALHAFREAGIPGDRPLIGLSVRTLRTGAEFVSQMAAFCDRLTRELDCHVVFVAMQRPHDVTVSREIMSRMTESAYLLGDLSPEALISACGQMELVVAMRLHTMLFAAKAKTPVIGLICDPKIENFSEKLNMPSGGPIEDFCPDRLLILTREMLVDQDRYRDRLTTAVAEMDLKAKENGAYLSQLL